MPAAVRGRSELSPTAARAFPVPQRPLRRGRAGKVEARVSSVTFPLKWLFGEACVGDVVLVGLFAGLVGWFGCFEGCWGPVFLLGEYIACLF